MFGMGTGVTLLLEITRPVRTGCHIAMASSNRSRDLGYKCEGTILLQGRVIENIILTTFYIASNASVEQQLCVVIELDRLVLLG